MLHTGQMNFSPSSSDTGKIYKHKNAMLTFYSFNTWFDYKHTQVQYLETNIHVQIASKWSLKE